MTENQIISTARTFSRISSLSVTDEAIIPLVTEVYRLFSKDVGGLYGETKRAVTLLLNPVPGSFTITTNGGDATFTFAPTSSQTGTHAQLITAFNAWAQTQWPTAGAEAGGVLTFDADSQRYVFTIDLAAVTSITAITDGGDDLVADLFGSPTVGTSSSLPAVIGTSPAGAKAQADVADFTHIEWVQWEDSRLQRVSYQEPRFLSSGIPSWFSETEDVIRIYPTPTRTPWVALGGRWIVTTLASIPADAHMALVHRVASLLCETNDDFERADRQLAHYLNIMREFRRRLANENPKIGFASTSSWRGSDLVNGEVVV